VTVLPDGLRFIVVKVHYFRKSSRIILFAPTDIDEWSFRSGMHGLYRETTGLLSTCSSRRMEHEALMVREISGSHGGEYEDDSLLGCSAV